MVYWTDFQFWAATMAIGAFAIVLASGVQAVARAYLRQRDERRQAAKNQLSARSDPSMDHAANRVIEFLDRVEISNSTDARSMLESALQRSVAPHEAVLLRLHVGDATWERWMNAWRNEMLMQHISKQVDRLSGKDGSK